MKLAFLMLAAAAHPVFAIDLTPTNCLETSGLVANSKRALTNHQEWKLSGDCGSNGEAFQSASTNLPFSGIKSEELPLYKISPLFSSDSPALNLRAGKAPLAGERLPESPPARLQPGVYQTFPYTCLVLVPGPHPDHVSAAELGLGHTEKMPVHSEGLEFIPFTAGK